MPPDPAATTPLASFDPPLARAVAAVLGQEGVEAGLSDDPSTGELVVLVDPDQRERALRVLAGRMEDVREAAAAGASPEPTAPPVDVDDGEEPSRPLVMERFRNMGFVAFLLAPLLVVTLAARGMTMAYAIVILVAGMVAIHAWRNRP